MRSRKVVAVTFGILLLVLVLWIVGGSQRAYAQSGEQSIPKSYGSIKAVDRGKLILEDASGTIHIVTIEDPGRNGGNLTIVRR